MLASIAARNLLKHVPAAVNNIYAAPGNHAKRVSS